MSKLNSVHELLAKLQGVNSTNQNEWMALCPGHSDKNTLSLSLKMDGNKILIHCFAGCTPEQILSPLDLTLKDLTISRGPKEPSRKIVATYDYRDAEGQLLYQAVRYEPKMFRQRRPDGNGGWIWNLKGTPRTLYRLADVMAAIELETPTYIVEGEKDVDNLRALGLVATTCAMGAGKWLASYSEILKNAKSIIILPDKDDPGRKHAAQIAASLEDKVVSLKVIELPGEGKDASDWISAGGTIDQLHQIVADAPEYKDQPDKKERADPTLTPRHQRYIVINGEPCHMRSSKEDGVYPAPLANWDGRIARIAIHDNGLAQVPYYEIDGAMAGTQKPLALISVPTAQFGTMSWVSERWPQATVYAGASIKDHLRSYLQSTLVDTKPQYVFTHSGWRQVENEMVYLSSAGGLDRDDVDVELDQALSRYSLPENPDDITKEDAWECSMLFMDIGKSEITIPIWAAMYLAPLFEILQPNFILSIVGRTGSFKSTIAALGLCHFGSFTDEDLPAHWIGDTKVRLMELMFRAKDIPLIIDNWMPGSSRDDQKDLDKKAHSIIQAIGDHAGRGRFAGRAAQPGSNDTLPPRCLVISTGEQLPDIESTQGRMFIIRIEPDDINPDKLTCAQGEEAKLYPYAMAHFLREVSMDYERLKTELPERFKQVRYDAGEKTLHRRLPSAVAYLYTAFEYAMQVFRDHGAITEEECKERCDKAWEVFTDTASRQAEAMVEQKPAYRFLQSFKTLLDQHKIVLINKDQVDLNEANKELRLHQAWVGWEDTEYFYLQPDITYLTISEYCARGNGVPIGKKHSVFDDLRRSGYTICQRDMRLKAGYRNTNRIWVGTDDRSQPTVIQLKRTALDSLNS